MVHKQSTSRNKEQETGQAKDKTGTAILADQGLTSRPFFSFLLPPLYLFTPQRLFLTDRFLLILEEK